MSANDELTSIVEAALTRRGNSHPVSSVQLLHELRRDKTLMQALENPSPTLADQLITVGVITLMRRKSPVTKGLLIFAKPR